MFLPGLIIAQSQTFRMFSLRDLRFALCSRDLDVLRAQRIIGFYSNYPQINEVETSDQIDSKYSEANEPALYERLLYSARAPQITPSQRVNNNLFHSNCKQCNTCFKMNTILNFIQRFTTFLHPVLNTLLISSLKWNVKRQNEKV